MEAMRTARLRLLRHKHELEVIDDAVHGLIIGYEGDDLHLTALMKPLTLLHEYCKAAAFGADKRGSLRAAPFFCRFLPFLFGFLRQRIIQNQEVVFIGTESRRLGALQEGFHEAPFAERRG